MSRRARSVKQVEKPANDPEPASPGAGGVILARLVSLDDRGEAAIALEGARGLRRIVPARTLGAVDRTRVGHLVAVMIEGAPPHRAVVLGAVVAPRELPEPAGGAAPSLELSLDGRRLTLSGSEEIVLRCGKSSITLHADGRVAIRGTKVVSRASGMNKIRGGSVQIN